MDLTCNERFSDSAYIERIWHTHSETGGRFQSIAQHHSEIVFTTLQGNTFVTLRGPETSATPAFAPPDAEFFAIQFKAGTFLPHFPAKMLMDRQDVSLPSATGKKFWLLGSTWEVPNDENADTFVNWLVRAGLLEHDPVVQAVLQAQPINMSLRTVQRRFLHATGLTHGVYRQIEQARYATHLLKQGVPILDVAYQAGYADQPHLTRSLKRFVGQTPVQIIHEHEREPLSLLFKTEAANRYTLAMANELRQKEVSA